MRETARYAVALALSALSCISATAAQDNQPPNRQQPAIPAATFTTEVVVTADRGSDERAALPVSTAVLTASS
jgi:hypothetical protein